MIPVIIPRKRILMLSLTLLFSSAIIISSSSILFSFQNVITDIYGSDEEIIVIRDIEANTPYTSKIPKSIDSALRQNENVLNISSEIILPISIKSEASNLRGVLWSDFTSINDISLINGKAFDPLDKSVVMLGVNLANRLGLSVGGYIRIGSTLNNKQSSAIIYGIFESESNVKQNDEVIAPLIFAEKLSLTIDFYTHILVKIDREHYSEEDLFDYISTKHQVRINAFQDNGSIVSSEWELKIFDFQNNLIHSKKYFAQAEQFLPFGSYKFQANKKGIYSDIVDAEIKENSTIDLFLDPLEYEVNITAKKYNEIAPNEFYELFNEKQLFIRNGYTDINGSISLILNNTKYFIRFWNGLSNKLYDFVVKGKSSLIFQLEEISITEISISGLKNGTIISENIGHFTAGELLNSSRIFLDNLEILPYYNKIPFQIENGNHNLTIININGNTVFYNFNVDSSFKYLNPNSFTNRSRFNIGDYVSLNMTGVNSNRKILVYINDQRIDTILSTPDELSIQLNTRYIGPARLHIEATTISNKFIYRDLILILRPPEESIPIAGIDLETDNIYLKLGAAIPIWWSDPNFDAFIENVQLEKNKTHILLPKFGIGVNTKNIIRFLSYSTDFTSIQQEINIVDNYASLIMISHDNINFTLQNITTITSDNILIDYDDIHFDVFIKTNSYRFQIIPGRYPIQINGENIDNIIIKTIFDDQEEVYNVQFTPSENNFLPFTTQINRVILWNGSIDLKSPVNNLFDWNFTSYDNGILKNIKINQTAYLSPGKWNVTIIDLTLNSSYSFDVTVVPWRRSIEDFSGKYESIFYNSEDQGSLFLIEKIGYKINNEYFYNDYYEDTIYEEYYEYERYYKNPRISHLRSSRMSPSNSFLLELSDIVTEAIYVIQLPNGTLISQNYYGPHIISFNNTEKTTLNLHIIVKNYFGNEFTENYEIILNNPEIQSNITIINDLLFDLPDFPFDHKLFRDASSPINIDNLNNSHSYYDLRLTNDNINLDYNFKVFANTSSIQNFFVIPNILEGIWNISINIQGMEFNFERKIVENVGFELLNNYLKLISQDLNYADIYEYSGLIMLENQIDNEQIMFKYDYNHKLPVLFDNFRITTYLINTIGEVNISNSSIGEIIIPSILINQTGEIRIVGNYAINSNSIRITHIYSNVIVTVKGNAGIWFVTDFPIGNVSIEFNQGTEEYKYIVLYEPHKQEIILFINIGSSDLNSWLGYSGVLHVSSSSALGENALEGPLSYVQVIIYAEIVIILFALNVNILGVFTGLISESIKELKVAKNIGFTNHQLILSLLYELRYLGVVVTIIGGIIGMIINWVLLVSDATILFGYTFYPVYDLKIWLIDIIAIYCLSLISATIGLRTENIN